MIIEVRYDPEMFDPEAILGYADIANNKWSAFKYQWKCDGVAVVIISEWADDPQVAWGF